jgi:hypothetical protein
MNLKIIRIMLKSIEKYVKNDQNYVKKSKLPYKLSDTLK